jgi:hypothetical protein
VVAALVLASQGVPLVTWAMFLFAAQYVMVQWRDQQYSALQFGLVLMLAVWHDPTSIGAVFLSVAAYEVVTRRAWYKALFNVVSYTATYGLMVFAYLWLETALGVVWPEWGSVLALLGAALVQEGLMSAALWIPVRMTLEEWWEQERMVSVAVMGGVALALLVTVWPFALPLALAVTVLVPLLSQREGL